MHVLSRTIDVLRAGIDAGLHLGAQLCVSVGGEVVCDTGVGQARFGVEMSPTSVVHWLSAGKPLTAVAVAQLWERGRLRLDDPVALHIPEFGVRGKDAVTIRHLLTHTAGFRAFGLRRDQPLPQALVEIYAMPLEPNWVPGKKAGYHSLSSWYVLGELVTRLSGVPISEYVRRFVCAPAEMTDTSIGLSGDALTSFEHRLAFVYDTSDHPPAPSYTGPSSAELNTPSPGSNTRGTARDMVRFYDALLSDRLVSEQTREAMTARHRAGLHDRTFGQSIDFGLGFLINSSHYKPDSAHPYSYGRHASARTFGHSGSQSSCAFVDPEQQLIVAWHCNGTPGEPCHQSRQVAINEAIYEDLGLTT